MPKSLATPILKTRNANNQTSDDCEKFRVKSSPFLLIIYWLLQIKKLYGVPAVNVSIRCLESYFLCQGELEKRNENFLCHD